MRKWVQLSGRKRVAVGETWGDNVSWSIVGWREVNVERENECTLDSLRNLEVPSGVRGPKDRPLWPLTQIPLLANIPVLQIYWLLRNNKEQVRDQRRRQAMFLVTRDSKHWCSGCGVSLVSLTSQQFRTWGKRGKRVLYILSAYSHENVSMKCFLSFFLNRGLIRWCLFNYFFLLLQFWYASIHYQSTGWGLCQKK